MAKKPGKKGYEDEISEDEIENDREDKSLFEKAKEKLSDVIHHPIQETKKAVQKVRGVVPGIESHPKFAKFKKGSN